MQGNSLITRVTTTTTRRQRRTGINTGIVAQIDRESQGDKLRSTAMIPFMREKNVNFVADGLKPNTRIYPFFDKVNVTNPRYPNKCQWNYRPPTEYKGWKDVL